MEDQLREAANELSKTEEKLVEFRNRAFAGSAAETVTPDNLRDVQAQLAAAENRLQSALDLRKSLERRLQEHKDLRMALKALPPPRAEAQAAPAAAVAPPPPPPPSPLEIQLDNKRTELASAKLRYTGLHPEIARLTREMQQLEALVKQQPRPVQPPPPAAPAPKEKQGEVPSLPTLDASIDLLPAEIEAELEQANRDIAKTQRDKNALSAKLASYQERLNPPPAVAQELAQLTRENDVARQRYNYLSNTRLNSDMATRVDSSENNELFRVVDAAFLPQKPIGPNRRLLASVGAMAGLVLGLAFAFMRDFIDGSLHTEEEVLSQLRLPVLTSVPTVPKDRKKKRKKKFVELTIPNDSDHVPGSFSFLEADSKVRDVVLNSRNIAGEHFRLLYSMLSSRKSQRPLKKILISSARPNEGKTFSACCLAGILAQNPGKKVLLIDADMRTAGATEMLGLKDRKSQPNFQALLRGEATPEECVLRCKVTNLFFLPNDVTDANPLKLLSSPELQYLLQHGTESFDWVIIDMPPILATADAGFILPFCDGILFVVQSSRTSVNLVEKCIKRVGQENIVGVVLNGVKAKRGSYYYYGDYYPSIQQGKSISNVPPRLIKS